MALCLTLQTIDHLKLCFLCHSWHFQCFSVMVFNMTDKKKFIKQKYVCFIQRSHQEFEDILTITCI